MTKIKIILFDCLIKNYQFSILYQRFKNVLEYTSIFSEYVVTESVYIILYFYVLIIAHYIYAINTKMI